MVAQPVFSEIPSQEILGLFPYLNAVWGAVYQVMNYDEIRRNLKERERIKIRIDDMPSGQGNRCVWVLSSVEHKW